MNETEKTLNGREKHLLILIRKGTTSNGWTVISLELMPFVRALPQALVELRNDDRGKFARLTEEGNSVMNAMAWLS